MGTAFGSGSRSSGDELLRNRRRGTPHPQHETATTFGNPLPFVLAFVMLQSVSVHLMDERRLSRLTFDDRRGSRMSRRGTLADVVFTSSHHLCPPQWYGIGIIEDFQPAAITPADNPLGWAVFNPLPIRGPTQRPRNRTIGMPVFSHLLFNPEIIIDGVLCTSHSGAWQ
ncbi:hypothetical protein ANCDUO_23531 [Ancylostoma duodenale]|uniref:Uncharacterized protein n=1 Tax=Ancylostoma duodenale TaxID=51022 RepID=A0A0C2C9F2_9BILA|nr:hypothetical protein ANCDUO_23531 [Ancylostoma duodenale]